MTTSIKILAEHKDQSFFTDDEVTGVERIGRGVVISRSTTKVLSGVKKTLSDSTRRKKTKRSKKATGTLPPNEQDATFSNKIRHHYRVQLAYDIITYLPPKLEGDNFSVSFISFLNSSKASTAISTPLTLTSAP